MLTWATGRTRVDWGPTLTLELQLKWCPNRIGELQPTRLLRMAGWLHAFFLPLVSLWTALRSGWRPRPHSLSLRIEGSQPRTLQQRNDIYGLENDDKMQTCTSWRTSKAVSTSSTALEMWCDAENDIKMQVGAAADDGASKHLLWAPGACSQRALHAKHHWLWPHFLCGNPGCRKTAFSCLPRLSISHEARIPSSPGKDSTREYCSVSLHICMTYSAGFKLLLWLTSRFASCRNLAKMSSHTAGLSCTSGRVRYKSSSKRCTDGRSHDPLNGTSPRSSFIIQTPKTWSPATVGLARLASLPSEAAFGRQKSALKNRRRAWRTLKAAAACAMWL